VTTPTTVITIWVRLYLLGPQLPGKQIHKNNSNIGGIEIRFVGSKGPSHIGFSETNEQIFTVVDSTTILR